MDGYQPRRSTYTYLFTKSGMGIPRKDTIRILGMLISENGRNPATIKKLQQHTATTVPLIQKISGRRRGIKEDDLLQLLHALFLSHINYAASMHAWTTAGKAKLKS